MDGGDGGDGADQVGGDEDDKVGCDLFPLVNQLRGKVNHSPQYLIIIFIVQFLVGHLM